MFPWVKTMSDALTELEWWNAKWDISVPLFFFWWVRGVANWCDSFLRNHGSGPNWSMFWIQLLTAFAFGNCIGLRLCCINSWVPYSNIATLRQGLYNCYMIYISYHPPKTFFNQNKSLISAPKTPFNNSRVDRGVGSSPLRSMIWPIWSWSRWKKCPAKRVGHFVCFFFPLAKGRLFWGG